VNPLRTGLPSILWAREAYGVTTTEGSRCQSGSALRRSDASTSSLKRKPVSMTLGRYTGSCRSLPAVTTSGCTAPISDRAVEDARHESLIAGLTLPDADDRHVLEAAITCQAGVIVTYNLRDFPDSELASFEIEVQHPDEFIRHLFDLSPAAVCQAVRELRSDLRVIHARRLMTLLHSLPKWITDRDRHVRGCLTRW
jgi:hypothetical protein